MSATLKMHKVTALPVPAQRTPNTLYFTIDEIDPQLMSLFFTANSTTDVRKIATVKVVDNLTAGGTEFALSAQQGVVLKQLIDNALNVNSFEGQSNIDKLIAIAKNGVASTSGNRAVVLGASTERSFNSSFNTTAYSRTNNVVTLTMTVPTFKPLPGQLIHVHKDNDPSISAYAEILTCTKSGNNYTVTIDSPGPNVASSTNVQVTFSGLATNDGIVMQLLNGSIGGALDITNFATASTNTLDWVDLDRFAFVESHGPFDFGYLGLGIGNDINNPVNGSADVIANRVYTALELYSKIIRRGLVIGPMGSSSTLITPTAAQFTTMMLLEDVLEREIPKRFPNFEYVSTYRHAVRYSSYGNTDTTELTNGRPNSLFFETSSFIHYTPLGSMMMYEAIKPYFEKFYPSKKYLQAVLKPESISYNTALDPGNASSAVALCGWFGNEPTSSVTLSGVGVIGNAPTGTTITATGLVGGMTANISLENNAIAGRDLVFVFNDPIGPATAPVVTIKYNGGANPIVNILNDLKFQNFYHDMWGEISLSGFNPGALKFIDVTLVGMIGSQPTFIASLLGDCERSMGTANGKVWRDGVSSVFRTPGKFKIPVGVYTDGFIQITIAGNNNLALGSAELRFGNFRVVKRVS